MAERAAGARRGNGRRRPAGERREDAYRTRGKAASLHRRIYHVVKKIPGGRVATYGQVAALAGLGRQPRLVGYALHALPDGAPVPWHRVINAQGRVSLRPGSGGHAVQRHLLEEEGVVFDARDRVSLERFQWRPRRTRIEP